MTTSALRFDIIALLCDADFRCRSDTNTWTHRDSRPFSREEQAHVFEATRAELEEVRCLPLFLRRLTATNRHGPVHRRGRGDGNRALLVRP